jgi:hypothetical protein
MRRPFWATRYNLVEFGKVVLIIGAVIIVGIVVSTWIGP